MARLPPELLIGVVDALHDGLTIPDQQTHFTLASLCLTSHFLHELSMPLLYSAIRVVLPGACEHLAQSAHVAKYLKTVSILEHRRPMREFIADIPVFSSLLTHARNTLRSVTLYIPVRESWSGQWCTVEQLLPFRCALESLTSIETVVVCRDGFLIDDEDWTNGIARCILSPSWKGLRRLSPGSVVLDEPFVTACLSLPHLETLFLHNVYSGLNWDALPALTRLVRATKPSRSPAIVVYICITGTERVRFDVERAQDLAKQHDNLRIINLQAETRLITEDTDMHPARVWVREMAESGMLWQLPATDIVWNYDHVKPVWLI
ncbi:hypothetical protein PUNSTDRAFT_138150 [Punctularia strigosozonata HHB-11173 SS5]|uniref:F-box domain-containing protein n=1 Tax=Punctularia strigosozonata (strain HHB-11173) TaxID=741275 RepID=R7S420_PUNST|nr:uncharacterized protein PUNSTDRAFT_138150 [Punctularia strigosozonata HHB-11173 SS5]EIN04963.1 hypothetical protein PUNSTDRAFT_138150 [Punctularia strigosozonata HHB-11173 SS5]